MTNIKLFEYEHKKIRTIFAHGEIWFVAKDTVEALERLRFAYTA